MAAILTYHSLDESGSVISLAPSAFRAQIEWLVRRGVSVVRLEEIGNHPQGVALTFDDGFVNFYEHAFPLLCQYHLPATVFVVAQYCGRANDWPGQLPGIPRLELMNWRQLREIAAHGVTLGCHTATHPRLSLLSRREIEQELDWSREQIEQQTGTAVTTLAYPYGDSNRMTRACARERFRMACGTRLALLSPSSDWMNLPRLDIYYLRRPLWFEALADWRGRAYLAARRSLRAIREQASATIGGICKQPMAARPRN